jgi:DNA-binding response OmpR family regulator
MRALVVDDDPSIRMMLEFALGDEGYEVVTASNGTEALERARKQTFDVVLLDVMMPFVDGIQVASALSKDRHCSKTPIIMLTARTGDEDVWAGWRAGASSYLTKPIDFDLLFTEIKRVIADRKLEVASAASKAS